MAKVDRIQIALDVLNSDEELQQLFAASEMNNGEFHKLVKRLNSAWDVYYSDVKKALIDELRQQMEQAGITPDEIAITNAQEKKRSAARQQHQVDKLTIWVVDGDGNVTTTETAIKGGCAPEIKNFLDWARTHRRLRRSGLAVDKMTEEQFRREFADYISLRSK